MKMKLITVQIEFSNNTEAALDIFRSEAINVRKMDGCIFYELFEAKNTVLIMQKWRSDVTFEAYRSSNSFTNLGLQLKPLMSSIPVTTIATID